MEIKINGIEQNICDFTTDVLSVEKKRLERKMLNMEYVSDEEVTVFLAIDEELKKRSEQ